MHQRPNVDYEAMGVSLRVVLIGDYDNDGSVGQADLDLVLLNWGIDAGQAGVPAGWINQQRGGLIGQSTLDGVLLNWGKAVTSDVAAVPEPTTTVMLILGMIALHLRRAVFASRA